MDIKPLSMLEILKDIYECVNSSQYKNIINIDYLGSDENIPGLKIISKKKLSLEDMEKIMDIIYDCTENYDPNLIIHFEWETI